MGAFAVECGGPPPLVHVGRELFAATGDPNGKDLPLWQAFNSKSPVAMELGNKFAPIPVADPAKLDFFKQFFSTQDAWVRMEVKQCG